MKTIAFVNWTWFRIDYTNVTPTYEIASAGDEDDLIAEEDADFDNVSREAFMDVLAICRAEAQQSIADCLYSAGTVDGEEPREDLADILRDMRDLIRDHFEKT
jgi:hypothetical protein